MTATARIPISELKVGMYVERVEGESASCPIKQAGFVRSEAILMALKQYDVQYVVVKSEPKPSKNKKQPQTKSSSQSIHPKEIAQKLEDTNLATRIAKVLDLAKHAENQLRHLSTQIESLNEKDFEVLEHIANDINKVLSEDPVATTLLIRLHDAQPTVYEHCINVAMLTGLFVQEMGFESAICHELIMAGLLHDIGLTTVPKRIIENKSYLSDTEVRILQSHVDLGKEVLEAQYKTISDICLSAILHHHERLNGEGYPQGLKEEYISFWGKILAIVDSYESMTTSRYTKSKRTNNEAMAVLIAESGKNFDASLVALFAQYIGAYPVGSCVLCHKDQEPFLGIVTKSNPSEPLKPKVAIFFDVLNNRGIPMIYEDLGLEDTPYVLEKAVNVESYTPNMDVMSFLTRMRS